MVDAGLRRIPRSHAPLDLLQCDRADFKWLTMVLFAYVITAFLAKPDWAQVLRATFVPEMRWSSEYLSVLVGVLGTSISPYLFFWQAAQEVEEERARRKEHSGSTPGRNGSGVAPRPAGRDHGNVLFQLCDVLHHPDHGSDAARAWQSRRSRRHVRRLKRCGPLRETRHTCCSRLG